MGKELATERHFIAGRLRIVTRSAACKTQPRPKTFTCADVMLVDVTLARLLPGTARVTKAKAPVIKKGLLCRLSYALNSTSGVRWEKHVQGNEAVPGYLYANA